MTRVTVADLWRGTLAQLTDPHWRTIWVALLAMLVLTNWGQFRLLPFADPRAPAPDTALAFMAVMMAKLIGYNAISVAALRLACNSARAPWALDAGWWMHLIVMVIGFSFAPLIGLALGQAGVSNPEALWIALAIALVPLLLIARWRAAAAVEPSSDGFVANLAASPRYLLPALVVAAIVLVPLGIGHITLTEAATASGDYPTDAWNALIDGGVATVIAAFTLALTAAIYRQVAIAEDAQTQRG